MRIDRRFTKQGQDSYAGLEFRKAVSEIKNPDGSVVFRQENIEVPASWSQVATDILAQKYFRKAGVPAILKRVEENSVPSWLWRSEADEEALAALPEKERIIGERSSKDVFNRLAGTWTYWGWKGGYFDSEEDARAFYDEMCFMLADTDVRAQQPAVVQYRPALGLWHRWPGPGPLLCRLPDRQADQVQVGLRASPAACLLHSVHRRRPRQRGRHHGSVGARGPAVQVWLGHRLQLLPSARREREALGRRPLLRPDELPQDRRPRGGRHQVGRHHAPRRQDGGRRRRSSGHRRLCRLEGEGRAEGRRPRHRLEDRQEAPDRRHEGLRELRGPGRRLLRDREESRPQARRQGRPQGAGVRQPHQARHPVRAPGLYRDRLRYLRHRLGRRGLSHRFRPELQQFGARHRRIPARHRDRWRLEPHRAPQWQGDQDPQGARTLGQDRLCRLGLGRSGHPVPFDHQRLAHLPGLGRDPGVEPLLGIHVPRRYGLQPGFAEPAALPQCRDRCLRHRGLRACRTSVDHRAGNLGDDGAVPVEGNRPTVLRVPHTRPGLRQYRRPAHDLRHSL